jgi:Fe-S oxidoreductase
MDNPNRAVADHHQSEADGDTARASVGTDPREESVRIALFATRLGDAMFPKVLQATVRVVVRLGHTVVVPADQTCCGQMHINTGFMSEATPLVRHHVDVFEAALSSCDVAVAPSGSCVGCVRHQHETVARRADNETPPSGPPASPAAPTSFPSCSSMCWA